MGLSTGEVIRLRVELGYDAIQIANPYLTAYALFETVIKAYVEDGGETTSSTAVLASSTGDPAVVTLTLASLPTDSNGVQSLAASDRVIIDVDTFEERATVRAFNAQLLTIDVALRLAHAGTYRVMVDGGVAMVREKLSYIRTLTQQIQDLAPAGGVRKVDEVEFFSPQEMSKILGPAMIVWQQREAERSELADFVGVMYLRKIRKGGGGSTMTVY